MIIRKDFFKTDSVLPAVVFGCSILNLYNQFNNHSIISASAILSVIGLAGIFLFVVQSDYYIILIYIWLSGQLLIITHAVKYEGTDNWYNESVFDLSQVFKFILSFTLDTYSIGVNILPIIGFGLLKALKVSSLTGKLIGKQIKFYQFGENNLLREFFPLEGKIIKQVILSGEKDWLLVELSQPFQFEGSDIHEVIVKRNDGEVIKINSTDYQLVWFRLVLNNTDLTEGDNQKEKFPFIDWALCQ